VGEVFQLKTQDSGFVPEWKNIKKRHMDDPCASRVIQYAECWVSIMNAQLGNGNKKFAEIAEESLQIARKKISYELSPFQYGCMVTLLHQYWKYGENLRRWHNLRVGGEEIGKKANIEGWVINPGLSIQD